MTLAEMKASLRRRVDDVRATRWSNADLTAWLNESARFVGDLAETESWSPRGLLGQDTLNVTPGTTSYNLSANVMRIHRVARTDTTPPKRCRIIDVGDIDSYIERNEFTDRDGRPYVHFGVGTDGVFKLRFPVNPPESMTILVEHSVPIGVLVDGTDDANAYKLPAQLHPLIVKHAAVEMLGSDAAAQQAAAAAYTLELENARRLLGSRPEMTFIEDDAGHD